MKRTGIYSITNVLNGNRYIGSAGVSLSKRWIEHRSLLNRHRHHARHLQHAWNKYGEDAFQYEVLLECHPQRCLMWEQFFMLVFRPTYNVAPRAISPLGVKHTDKARARMSEAHKGKRPSPEHRAKLSAAKIGNKNGVGNKNHLGHKHSLEARMKIKVGVQKAHAEGRVGGWPLGSKHSLEARMKMKVGIQKARAEGRRCGGRPPGKPRK